jgi:superfamily II DNA or RNA helicase
MLRHEIGTLSATTAFGKTVIGANLIAERKVNTLVLVHTSALLAQWKKSLSNFLIISEQSQAPEKSHGRKKESSSIGQLGGAKNTLGGIVDIAIMHNYVLNWQLLL